MEKVVNEAHRSKFQTLEQFYTSEDLLVFDIETTGFTAELDFYPRGSNCVKVSGC